MPAGAAITDVNITVDFEKEGDNNCGIPDGPNSFSNQISMALTSPNATAVNLVFDHFSPPATYPVQTNAPAVVVTFDDAAALLVGTGPTTPGLPESGTFRPAEPLAAFNGEAPHGTWTFTFGDNVPSDYLCFNSYDLEVAWVK